MKIIFSSIVFLIFITSPVFAEQPNHARKNSCELIEKFVKEGGKTAIGKIANMFSHDENLAKQIPHSMAVLENYIYESGMVYLVAEFGDISEQHFIVLSTRDEGTFYAGLIYEKHKNELILANLQLHDSYKKVIDTVGPFTHEPKKINCPEVI